MGQESKTEADFAGPQISDVRGDLYKRPLDLTILTVGGILVLPVLILLCALTSLAIWIEDRGPVLYWQERVGQNGTVFKLLKFRSMQVQKDESGWSEQTEADDARITRVGRFVRRTALDELPQVINLWRGDISFVGPRALPTLMHLGYVEDEPRFVERLAVRPGLTGLAQIYLPRHCAARKRLSLDLLYLRKKGLFLDLRLIAFSIWVTLTGEWGNGPRSPSRESSQKGL